MNGKCFCIAAFFLLQKSKMLQYVNNGGKFGRFACRAAASSNNGLNLTTRTSAALKRQIFGPRLIRVVMHNNDDGENI